MDAGERRLRINKITKTILAGAYHVSNTLGVGFLERVYENALCHEFRKRGLKIIQQPSIQIWYDGAVVGDYRADLVVEDELLVELKVAKQFDEIHLAQCLNYLKATRMRICLLLNFGQPKVEVKRIVHEF